MAKKSAVEKNKRRAQLIAKYADKRAALKAIARDNSYPAEERFAARPAAQPMRNHGPAAGLLSQVQDVAHCAT